MELTLFWVNNSNGHGIYRVFSTFEKPFMQETVFEIRSKEGRLRDVCKDLDIDYFDE